MHKRLFWLKKRGHTKLVHEGLKGFCKSKNLFECLKLLVQLRTPGQHSTCSAPCLLTFMMSFQTIPRSSVVAYCSQFSLVTNKANSNLQKRKWYDGKIFISIFYRHFIINLYLYPSVILPTVFITRSGLPRPVPFNQFCIFLSPKFGLFDLKTDISSLY